MLVSAWLVAKFFVVTRGFCVWWQSFCFQVKAGTAHALLCVGFLELMKQGEAFSALLVVRGFAGQQVCLCFDGLFCFCGMLLGI